MFITKENNNFMVGVRGIKLIEQNPGDVESGRDMVSFLPFPTALET